MLRRQIPLLVLTLTILASSAPGILAQKTQPTQFVTPDTTTFTISTGLLLPWETKKHRAGTYGPGAELILDDGATSSIKIDGLHKLDNPGQWLFTMATASDLDGLLPELADRNDILRYDGASGFTKVFCGSTTTDPVPPRCNIDAVYLVGDDDSDIVVSFDQCGATIRGETYEAADLVQFTRSDPTDCNGWSVAGLVFDASGKIPSSTNVIGASRAGNQLILSLDVATHVPTKAGSTQFIPGQLVRWDGTFFSLYENLPGWPQSTQVNALTLPSETCRGLDDADPGDRIVDLCTRAWTSDSGGRFDSLEWRVEAGALAYNVYRSNLNGAVFGCQTPEPFVDRQYVTPELPPSDSAFYYLVTVIDGMGEGSLGNASSGAERTNSAPCGGGTAH